MSYGTVETFRSKTALKKEIEANGAHSVSVFGTSVMGDEKAGAVEDIPTGGVIVGPDVYLNRRWYAQVVRKADGTVTIK